MYRKRCDLSSQILLGYTPDAQTLEQNLVHSTSVLHGRSLNKSGEKKKEKGKKKNQQNLPPQIPKVAFYFQCLAKYFCSK